MKTRSTVFLAIAIAITLLTSRCCTKKQPTVAENFDNVSLCTSTSKTFKQIFSSRIGTFIWLHVDFNACELHIIRLKRKNNIKKKNCALFLRK